MNGVLVRQQKRNKLTSNFDPSQNYTINNEIASVNDTVTTANNVSVEYQLKTIDLIAIKFSTKINWNRVLLKWEMITRKR